MSLEADNISADLSSFDDGELCLLVNLPDIASIDQIADEAFKRFAMNRGREWLVKSVIDSCPDVGKKSELEHRLAETLPPRHQAML